MRRQRETGQKHKLLTRIFSGAEGESRTPTRLPSLDPEPSVSTNSTTSARCGDADLEKTESFDKNFFHFFSFFFESFSEITCCLAPEGFLL